MGRMVEPTDLSIRRSVGQSMGWRYVTIWELKSESSCSLTLCHRDSPLMSASCLVSNQLLPFLSSVGFCHHHSGPDRIILSGLPGYFSLSCQVHVRLTLFLSQVRLGKRMQPYVCGRSYYHPFPRWRCSLRARTEYSGASHIVGL